MRGTRSDYRNLISRVIKIPKDFNNNWDVCVCVWVWVGVIKLTTCPRVNKRKLSKRYFDMAMNGYIPRREVRKASSLLRDHISVMRVTPPKAIFPLC